MPHVMVKIRKGTPEEKKKQLAEAIVENVVEIAECGEDAVSVAIEEIDPKEWKQEVYDPFIRENIDALYKKPGYSL